MKWRQYRTYVDYRLGLKSDSADFDGGEFDG